ncbi:hypothetical protein FRC17_001315 [Serendipita sp. 399]|nr:hypothetical protein FRC17_001315 [Serendipita sp. 399]
MRFSSVFAYFALVSVTAVVALPVHHPNHEGSTESTTGNSVAHRDGHPAPAPAAAVVPTSSSSSPSSADAPAEVAKLQRRTLNTGNLSPEKHLEEQEKHRTDKTQHDEDVGKYAAKHRKAKTALEAEQAKPNANPETVARLQKDHDRQHHLLKEAQERSKASAEGMKYHQSTRSALLLAKEVGNRTPTQDQAREMQGHQDAAALSAGAYAKHTTNADRAAAAAKAL